jgi:quercetin dioxygenase-like cupin family protein
LWPSISDISCKSTRLDHALVFVVYSTRPGHFALLDMEIIMFKRLLPVLGLLTIVGTAHAEMKPSIESKILLQSSSSWDGTPYTAYPTGQPELTVRKVNMPPNSSFDWHKHPMPAAGYVVSGELIVEGREGGKKVTLTAGQVLPEMNNIVHRGSSGDRPTELIVFYAGTPGMPISIDAAP